MKQNGTYLLDFQIYIDVDSSSDSDGEEPQYAQFCKTKNGAEGIVFGGHTFTKDRLMKDRKSKQIVGRIWRCAKRKADGCDARIHVDLKNRIHESPEDVNHTHFADPILVKVHEVSNLLLEKFTIGQKHNNCYAYQMRIVAKSPKSLVSLYYIPFT